MISRDIIIHYRNTLISGAANIVISLLATTLDCSIFIVSVKKLKLEYAGSHFKRLLYNCRSILFINQDHSIYWSVSVKDIAYLPIGFCDFCLSFCVIHVDHADTDVQTER